jgi:hypothetical protein
MKTFGMRVCFPLLLGLVAFCGPRLFADSSSHSGDFVITTPDGRSGTITLARVHTNWAADKAAAKILGIGGGKWLPLTSIILTDGSGSVLYACLENCDWNTFSEGDKGVIDIDPSGNLNPNQLRKNTILAQWKCTSDI